MDDSLLWTRRAVMGGGLAMLGARAAWSAPPAELIAGTYMQEGGKGLYPLISGESGWAVGEPVSSIVNISFGTREPRSGFHYLIAEGAIGRLGLYDRGLRPLAERSMPGSGPCHVAISPDRSAVAVANYGSGSILLYPLDRVTGLPGGEGQEAQHHGTGPDAQRQTGPHAHWVGFTRDSRWLHSVDLGADSIFAHGYDASTQKLGEMRIAFRAPAGAGPRHLARHPRLPVCYLVAELANTLTVLAASEDGTFRQTAVMSTLPQGFAGASQVAHIAPNAAGTRLYVSNRGHDSIAVFALAPDGAASLIQHVDCGGHWPRFFLLLEDRGELLVANERSGTVTCLAIAQDGRLRSIPGSLDVPGVAFLDIR
ncbi:lactonase family protein [Sphingomonas sp.]|uniref:lactonase family protein n=1 Tax=Sphingomonas sp. TaxID=28214 RepID=UPI000DB2E7E4|nr:lactonase family protein [Sphingomonas sp.]PZU09100.1 MAG: 6-phosphogluconolactonase [Sphingomonas sp.]